MFVCLFVFDFITFICYNLFKVFISIIFAFLFYNIAEARVVKGFIE